MKTLNEYFERSAGSYEFTPDYEENVRQNFSHPDGLPQDKLVWASYHFVGEWGLSTEYRWASGRQDSHNFLELTDEMVMLNPPQWLERMKETYLHARAELLQTLRAEKEQQRGNYDRPNTGNLRAGEAGASAG